MLNVRRACQSRSTITSAGLLSKEEFHTFLADTGKKGGLEFSTAESGVLHGYLSAGAEEMTPKQLNMGISDLLQQNEKGGEFHLSPAPSAL